ncbi:MAG: hypothetical protein WBC73_06470 [Phormidesmis sp.]
MKVVQLAKYKLRRVKRVLIGKDRNASNHNTSNRVVRRDVVFIPVGQNAELEVYWKLTQLGNGPSIILYVLSQPVIRFDCFGADAGHAHLYIPVAATKRESRWWLPETSIEDQIERGLFEISKNTNYWIQRHRNPIVYETNVNAQAIEKAVDTAREYMHDYAERTRAVLYTRTEVSVH